MSTTPQEYWGVLIDPEKKCPTPRLDALLSGIATYVIKNLEPREHHVLSGEKLAAFYRSVGGDYDRFFLEMSPASLSFVYQALGCYHSLQPDVDPFKPPIIPALTASGFRRWQTIQLLLEPAQQIPLLQEAVRRYDIVNKLDGHVFPKVLPTECLPLQPDPGMVKWHDESLQRLKREAEQEAATKDNPPPAMAREQSSDPDSPEEEEEAKGYFSIGRLKGKVASRWEAFRGDGRPPSREDWSPRERNRDGSWRAQDEGPDGTYSNRRRPNLNDENRRRSHAAPGTSDGFGRPPRSKTSAAPEYDNSAANAGPGVRMRSRPKYASRSPSTSPAWPDRDRFRERDAPPASPRSTTSPSRPPVTRYPRPSADRYNRRHSSHEPYSPRSEPEPPDYSRARSRSHNGRSPNERLSPSDAYTGAPRRSGSTFGHSQSASGSPATTPPPFARGSARHTVHSPGRNAYRGDRDEPDVARMNAGVRYLPAERSRRAERA